MDMGMATLLRQFAVLLAGGLVTMTAGAYDTRQYEIDWAEALQLSHEQQQQIDSIEQRYREQNRQLRPDCAGSANRSRLMRKDMHQVLTAEQRETARVLMHEQHQQLQLRHARELAHRLRLDDAQKEQFLQAVAALKDDYQWPLDIAQHDAARRQFEGVLQSVLSAEQLDKWQQMRKQTAYNWPKHGTGAETKPCRSKAESRP